MLQNSNKVIQEGMRVYITYLLGRKELGYFKVLAVFDTTFLAKSEDTKSELFFEHPNAEVLDGYLYIEGETRIPIYLYELKFKEPNQLLMVGYSHPSLNHDLTLKETPDEIDIAVLR